MALAGDSAGKVRAPRRDARPGSWVARRRVRRAVGTALATCALAASLAQTPAPADFALHRAVNGGVAAAAVDDAPAAAVPPIAGRVAFVGGAVSRLTDGRDVQPAAADVPAPGDEMRPAHRKKATPEGEPEAEAPSETPTAPASQPTAGAASIGADAASTEPSAGSDPPATPDARAAKKADNANNADKSHKAAKDAPPPTVAADESATVGTPADDQMAPVPAEDPAAVDPAASSTATPSESPVATPAPSPAAIAPTPMPTAPAPAPTEPPRPKDAATPTVTDTVWIVGSFGADCHADMDIGSPVLAVLPEGAEVGVIGRTIGDWQPVLCNGSPGYLRASSITWWPPAPPDPATPATGAANDATPTAAASADKNSGKQIVNFALQYVGYPYVNAAEGPNAFDCSGFTMFVIQHTLGLNVTHDMFVQYDMGTKIDRNDLQPGDLVFFQNTDRPGLSHVGIYIGDGQFVDAENEQTGVVVSDLGSDYYASRWYGAVRYP